MTKMYTKPTYRRTDSTITAKTAQDAMDAGFRMRLFSKLQISKTDKDKIKSQLEAFDLSSSDGGNNATAVKRGTGSQATCLKCSKKFDPKDNNESSCHYHEEVFTEWIYSGKNWKGEEVADLEQWTCCLKNHPLHPGCKVGKHLEWVNVLEW